LAKQFQILQARDIAFIEKQKLFFLASVSDAEVNLSPKGYDSIKVLNEKTLLYCSLPGSGNRTYRDASNGGKFTLVFNAYEGAPQILRLFCRATVVEPSDEAFKRYAEYFAHKISIIRNIFLFHIETVESSCGMSIPYYEYKGERNELKEWAIDMDRREELEAYMNKRHTPKEIPF
jgi:hypothetical protein